ncbi:CLIP-associating protein 1 [Phytophthora ramorum]|uniref:CLIP-associating protein 1 n=1 Tax=Phytophthora ramorum TaxID=164328 RepID=UPI0030B701FD|nr:CLIP-associating protein 1 [Phytophthora ramorum]
MRAFFPTITPSASFLAFRNAERPAQRHEPHGRTNAVLELGKRLLQRDDAWKDKCAALTELRQLLDAFSRLQSETSDAQDVAVDLPSLLSPENMQALTQPFRATLTDLRSTVVKEASATLALLAQTLGPVRCKILVRDLFPTLLEARGGSNKVNTGAVNSCIEAIVEAVPSRFVLAPVLRVLDTTKNRDLRESCIHYTFMALEGWNSAVLERFRIRLQPTIAASLSDASPKGREKARECYWKYVLLWPDELERMNALLADGVKKHLKRSRNEADLEASLQPAKRRHLATITNTVSSKIAAKKLFAGAYTASSNRSMKNPVQRLNSRGGKSRTPGDRRITPSSTRTQTPTTPAASQPSRIPLTPTSALRKPREGKVPSQIPTPPHLTRTESMAKIGSTDGRNPTPSYLTTKFAQLQDEKTSLAEKLKTQTHELQRLQEQIQMMNEERRLCESHNREAMAATMSAHAVDTATQQQIQYELAEQVASQEAQLEDLRTQLTTPPTTQEHSEKNKHLTQLTNEVSSLSGQLEATTVKLQCYSAKGGDTLRSTELEELQAQRSAAVAALEEEKRVLVSEVSALKSGQSEAMAHCSEKDERMAQLEERLSVQTTELEELQAQRSAAVAALEEEKRVLVSEVSALKSGQSEAMAHCSEKDERMAQLEERLSVQTTELEELQAQRSAAVAALEEEKRVLVSEVSALKSGQSEAMAHCSEKDERMAQLEERLSVQTTELEELQAQRSAAVAALEEEKRVLVSEVSALKSGQSEAMAHCSEKDERMAQLEERLSVQTTELEELQAQRSAAVAALEEEKRVLVSEVSALKSGQSEAMAHCSEKDERMAQLEERLSVQTTELEELQAQRSAAVAALEEEKRVLVSEVSALKSGQSEAMATDMAGKAECGDEAVSVRATTERKECRIQGEKTEKPKPIIPLRAFSLAFTRDRSEIEEEERRINETNLLKRRLRRQNRQR